MPREPVFWGWEESDPFHVAVPRLMASLHDGPYRKEWFFKQHPIDIAHHLVVTYGLDMRPYDALVPFVVEWLTQRDIDNFWIRHADRLKASVY